MKNTLIIALTILVFTANKALAQSDTLQPKLKGYDDFRKFVAHNLRYPPYAAENEISGVVNYSFIIDKEGCIKSIKIIESPDNSLSEATIQALLKTKCKWKPGKINDVVEEIEVHSRSVFVLQ